MNMLWLLLGGSPFFAWKWVVVDVLWLVVGGGGWWMVVNIFWLVVGGGGWCWVVVGGGIV